MSRLLGIEFRCGKKSIRFWLVTSGVTVALVIILCLSLLIKPFVVKNGNYAIVIDGHTKDIRVIDTPGTNILKKSDNTVIFTSNAITIDWYGETSLIIYSKDRVSLTFVCKYQYTLIKDNVEQIYQNFGTESELTDLSIWVLESAVAIAASNYTYEHFFQIRGTIENDMRLKIDEYMSRYKGYVISGAFQLLNIDFPKALSDAIAAKAASQQAVIASINTRDGVLSNASTFVQNAQYDASIAIINAIEAGNGIRAKADTDGRIAILNAEETAVGIILQADNNAQILIDSANVAATVIRTNADINARIAIDNATTYAEVIKENARVEANIATNNATKVAEAVIQKAEVDVMNQIIRTNADIISFAELKESVGNNLDTFFAVLMTRLTS